MFTCKFFFEKKKKIKRKTIYISFLCIHLKSISQADEIRTVFNKIIYRKKASEFCVFIWRGSLWFPILITVVMALLSLCSIRKYLEPGAKKSPWALAEMFSPTLAPQNPYCSAKWWESKKKTSFSATRNWRQLEAIGEISGVMYLLIAQVTDYDAFWEDRVEPPSSLQ